MFELYAGTLKPTAAAQYIEQSFSNLKKLNQRYLTPQNGISRPTTTYQDMSKPKTPLEVRCVCTTHDPDFACELSIVHPRWGEFTAR